MQKPCQVSFCLLFENDDIQGDNAGYDFDNIRLASSMNTEDEIRHQRRQLLREYNFPSLEQNCAEQGKNYRDNENDLKPWVTFD